MHPLIWNSLLGLKYQILRHLPRERIFLNFPGARKTWLQTNPWFVRRCCMKNSNQSRAPASHLENFGFPHVDFSQESGAPRSSSFTAPGNLRHERFFLFFAKLWRDHALDSSKRYKALGHVITRRKKKAEASRPRSRVVSFCDEKF